MSKLAILAGGGALSVRLAQVVPDAVKICFAGAENALGDAAEEHNFEKLGALFDALKAKGVTDVLMAGSMGRPRLNPTNFDSVMLTLAPRILMTMPKGDDALLSLLVAIFEEQGFTIRGAHEIDPSLTAKVGVLAGEELTKAQQADANRAIEILSVLSPLDVAQGAVVINGLCYGIETLQGTNALLSFVEATPAQLRKSGGIFVKAPKRGQDLRADMPTIGPVTIKAAAKAGLSAIVVAAGEVILLEREDVIALAKEANISLIAQKI